MPDIRDVILAAARSRFGLLYRLDPPPDGMTTLDCSLYVVQVLAAASIPFPPRVRTAEQIRQASVPIPFADVLPGDLLFFENTYDAAGPAGGDGKIASHIGFSLGAGSKRMLDANDGRGNVGETDISGPYWQDHLFDARRPPGLIGAEAPAPAAMLRGIDVSSHQGKLDCATVAASGVAFAFTKATGGTWYSSPTFATNWLGIKAAGLVRGAYHYAFETTGQAFPGDGPEAEADYFLTTLKRAGGVLAGDLLALDIEDGDGQLGDWALRWCRRVQSATGVTPLVYTGGPFSKEHGFGATPALANYPLWLASYQERMPPPPAPWKSVSIWQYSNVGRVPGIAGDVDLNQFSGTQAELLALGKPGPIDGQTPVRYAQPGDVGDGLLAWATELGTVPAAPSTFLPLGRSPAVIEELICMDGSVLRWHLPTGRRWRYPAA